MTSPDAAENGPVRPVPRELSAAEEEALVAVADALVDGGSTPAPSGAPGYPAWLRCALAARADAFEEVVAAAVEIGAVRAADRFEALRKMSVEQGSRFHALSSVVAGAYLLLPEVRAALGYPGQELRPAPFDEAAAQLMTGILDPVIERGPIHRTPELSDPPSATAVRRGGPSHA